MQQISVVIIAKNEEHIIGKTLKSLDGLTDDIVIGDTGSADNTIAIAKSFGAHVENISWEGFGKTKNKALAFAKYDWVLFLDADEVIDNEFHNFLNTFSSADINTAYKIRYKSYISNKRIRYGEIGHLCKIRLFNKNVAKWDTAEIHEKLIFQSPVKKKIAPGYILHYHVNSLKEYAEKMSQYAELVAQKYYHNGKKASWFKLYLAPSYQFIVTYIFQLGFLDGRIGFITSFFASYYGFLKYHRLKELIELGKTED